MQASASLSALPTTTTRRIHGRSVSSYVPSSHPKAFPFSPDHSLASSSGSDPTHSLPFADTQAPNQLLTSQKRFTSSTFDFSFPKSVTHPRASWNPAVSKNVWAHPTILWSLARPWGRWRLLLLVYLLMSVFILSKDIFGTLNKFNNPSESTADSLRVLSKLLPMSSPLTPSPLRSFLTHDHLDVFHHSAWSRSMEITACLLAHEADLVHLDQWMINWGGPMSLLVLTSHNPESAAYNNLARRLSLLNGGDSLTSLRNWASSPLSLFTTSANLSTPANRQGPRRLSVHLLYTPLPRSTVPILNALLNLARMHASTQSVLLLPTSLACLPIPKLHQRLVAANLGPQPLIIPHRMRGLETYVQGATMSSLSSMPTSGASAALAMKGVAEALDHAGSNGAALLIKREDPLWCTERFFTFWSPRSTSTYSSRLDDSMLSPGRKSGGKYDNSGANSDERDRIPPEWSECLWGILLEHPDAFQVGLRLRSSSRRFARVSTTAGLRYGAGSGRGRDGEGEWKDGWISWAEEGADRRLSNNVTDMSGTEGRKPQEHDIHNHIHSRLATQYRSEMCMLVARQRAAQGNWDLGPPTGASPLADIERSAGTSLVSQSHEGGLVEPRWLKEERVRHIKAMCESTLKLWGRYLE